MRIIIDANILIGALLGSRSRITILTAQNHELYCPRKVIDEVKKYKQLICARISCTPQEFDENLSSLLYFINLLEYVEYEHCIERARSAIADRDAKDTDYMACALALHADFIWTDDKDFSSQDIVPAKSTEEFIEEGKMG